MPANFYENRTNLVNNSTHPNFRYTSRFRMLKKGTDPRETPNYTLEEAARWLHVDLRKLHYWVIGTEDAAPLTTIFSRRPILLSFKNLVECFVLEGLRNTHGISLQAIRNSVEDLRIQYPSKHPLSDYELYTLGNTIYLKDGKEPLLRLATHGQQAFTEILNPFLRRVERNQEGFANTLFPFTRKQYKKTPLTAPRVVVIDPRVSFGLPVLVNSRISTAFLLARKKGGASISQLANDYGRSEAEIEEAIRLEEAA